MKLARVCGWLVWHAHDSRRAVVKDGRTVFVGDRDFIGWPDLTLIHPGRGIALFREIKVPPNKPTPDQLLALNALQACGLDAGVWVPADWPLIESTLQRKVRP